MNYWIYTTSKGVFSIVERSSRGVDAYFGQDFLGHYRSPVDAAEQLADGNHAELPCAPENGVPLGLPVAVHHWAFMRSGKTAAVKR